MEKFNTIITPTRSYIEFSDKELCDGRFGISMSNSKVQVPIVNVEPAIECSNRHKCPFSLDNYGKTGYPRCYAQDGEVRWSNVRKAREDNKDFLTFVMRNEKELLDKFTIAIINAVKHSRPFTPYIRINESGDLSPTNIKFFERLQSTARISGIKLYGYSKSDEELIVRLELLGATILRSEKDFVMVKSEEEAKEKGYKMCPGVCGPCDLCMKFKSGDKPIAIIGH